MPREPQHAAAEAPMARTAGYDDGIQLVLAHLPAQRGVAARIFGRRELLPHRIAVIRCVAHIGERQRLIELAPHHVPWLRPDARRSDLRADVHEWTSFDRNGAAFPRNDFGLYNVGRLSESAHRSIAGSL